MILNPHPPPAYLFNPRKPTSVGPTKAPTPKNMCSACIHGWVRAFQIWGINTLAMVSMPPKEKPWGAHRRHGDVDAYRHGGVEQSWGGGGGRLRLIIGS